MKPPFLRPDPNVFNVSGKSPKNSCKHSIKKRRFVVFELIKKSMLAGIGLALKTKDEVEDFAKELVKTEKMSEKEGKKFLDDLLKRYDEAKNKWGEMVEQSVRDMLKKANVVTAEQLEDLRKEIRELKESIRKKTDITP
jgi:polyhydroxyalkanoate synthesis regulator phasin